MSTSSSGISKQTAMPEVKAEVVDKMEPGDDHTDEDCTDGHIDGVEGDVASAHSCGDCPHCSCLPLPPPLRRCNLQDDSSQTAAAGLHYVMPGDAADDEDLYAPPCLPFKDNCGDCSSKQ